MTETEDNFLKAGLTSEMIEKYGGPCKLLHSYIAAVGLPGGPLANEVLGVTLDVVEMFALPFLDDPEPYRVTIRAIRDYLEAGIGTRVDIIQNFKDMLNQRKKAVFLNTCGNFYAIRAAIAAAVALDNMEYSRFTTLYATLAVAVSGGESAEIFRFIRNRMAEKVRWVTLETPPEKVFIRFGRWSDPSYDWITNLPEEGVSVLPAVLDRERLIVSLDPAFRNRRAARALMVRHVFAVTGTVVSTHLDGEPQLKSVVALPYAIDFRSLPYSIARSSWSKEFRDLTGYQEPATGQRILPANFDILVGLPSI